MTDPQALYVDLLVRCIANTIYGDGTTQGGEYDKATRTQGQDWPSVAHSMAGVLRLKSLAELTTRVIQEGVPGDLIETGVWRGGCCILMKGILAAHGVTDRTVYVADSFEGLPPPNPAEYPLDLGLDFHVFKDLAISEDQVRDNFDRYGLLDDKVQFVRGFFQDTLATLPVERLALLRLDGDLYESTIVALNALYPKLSVGGFVIIDDYGCFDACAQAVHHYRSEHGITDEIHPVDWTGVYWRKAS